MLTRDVVVQMASRSPRAREVRISRSTPGRSGQSPRPDKLGVGRVLALMETRDVSVGEFGRGCAPPVGVPHPHLAASDAMQVAVEVDVPEPVEAGFGEGRVERLTKKAARPTPVKIVRASTTTLTTIDRTAKRSPIASDGASGKGRPLGPLGSTVCSTRAAMSSR